MTIPGLRGHLVAQAFIASIDPDGHSAGGVMRTWSATAGGALNAIGPATPPRAILELLVVALLQSLGFDAVGAAAASGPVVVADARANGEVVLVLVAAWRERLDAHWQRAVVEGRKRGARWCLLFNGEHLRVVDAHNLYARRFVEIDLTSAIDRSACLAALERVASAAALCAPGSDPRSLDALIAASDKHSAGVRRSLRDGVLAASSTLLQALVAGARGRRIALDDSFEQALTIVYRILFLLFAEARALVPLWHPVYRDSYSIDSLRALAEASAHTGFWDALRAIARLAHAGCRAGDLQVTAFNGRLFAPARTPLAERRGLDDAAASRAILALSTRPAADRAGRERIVYRDLGVEQLGAVYETLLDYRPRAAAGSSRTTRVTLERGAGVRKATGTFYTPRPIAEYLVRHTLAPLVRDLAPDAIVRLRVVDPAMGSGAFLVAACRFLAGAYEDALVASGACHASDIDDGERTRIRRLVAERCLYGVDLNPMAVQLARLSLWLATLAADRPLSFLDHRLLAGDSLLGAWLADVRRPPKRRAAKTDASLPLFDERSASRAVRDALPIRFSLETPNDTPAQVRAKERALAALAAQASAIARWKRIADLWCAAWFVEADGRALSAAFAPLADYVLSGRSALPAHTAAAMLDRTHQAAARQRFFHWELEFPEVFFDAAGRRLERGGFDAVLGNPPWEMMRADGGRRHEESSPSMQAAALRFTRDSGTYEAQSDGHANQYQLFVERAIQLTRAGGRFGLVLPSGLTSDHGSAALRRMLFDRCDVDAIAGVENRRRIFPIHRSVRFVLLSATVGAPSGAIGLRLGIDSVEKIESSAALSLSIDALARLSGRSLALPYFRDQIDVAICEKAAALFRPLGHQAGWAVRFGRELNASDDRDAFDHAGAGLPVVDGRHLEPFRVALDRVSRSISYRAATARVGDRFARPRLAYRDVAGSTNRLTLIAAILPRGCVSTHTVFCLRSPLPLADQWLLCGFFNSLVVNYLVRLRVTTHVTTAIVEHLPIPTRGDAPAACREIAALARLLARRTDPRARAMLHARTAELYQLTRAEFEHVLGTFPLVEKPERDAALALFVERA